MHSVKSLESPEIWYVTGSQQISGEEALKKVAKDSRQIAEGRMRRAAADRERKARCKGLGSSRSGCSSRA